MTPYLSAYIDNEASPQEVQAIEAHLASCPICNANLESMREASVTYRSLVPVLPLATLKVWSASQAALLGGKAAVTVAGAAHGAASGAGAGGAVSTGVAGGGTAAGGATATAVPAAATTAAATAATAGMSILTKVVITITALMVAGGIGVGGYYGYVRLTKNLLNEYEIVYPKNGAKIELEEGADGSVTLPIKLRSRTGSFGVTLLVDGNEAKESSETGTFNWSTSQPGKHSIEIQMASASSRKTRKLSTFALGIRKISYLVIFVRNDDIWTAELDRNFEIKPGTETNLTSSTGYKKAEPQLSPDGKQIIFVRSKVEYMMATTGDIKSWEICKIDISGGVPTVVVAKKKYEPSSTTKPDYYEYWNLRWLPDQSGVLFMRKGSDYASWGLMEENIKGGSGRPWAKDSESTWLTNGFDLSQSGDIIDTIQPHGGGLENAGGFTVYSLDGQMIHDGQTNDGSNRYWYPAWLPDGKSFSVTLPGYGAADTTRIISSNGEILSNKQLIPPDSWVSDEFGLGTRDGSVFIVDFAADSEKEAIPNATSPCGKKR